MSQTLIVMMDTAENAQKFILNAIKGEIKMLRKGRLGRICKRCGEIYIPTGKKNICCKKCNKRDLKSSKEFWDRLIKLQNQRENNDNKNN